LSQNPPPGIPKGETRRGKGREPCTAPERQEMGMDFPAEATNQISLMKWGYVVKPIGSKKKDIRVLFF